MKEPENLQNLTSLYYIAGIVCGILIVYFTWRTAHYSRKESKETMPIITLRRLAKKGEIVCTVVNNKSHRITLKDILYSKKGLIFYSKKNKTKFIPPVKYPDKLRTNQSAQEIKYIESQENYTVTIPGYDPEATYKISVDTSVGFSHKILDSVRAKTK